MIELVDAPTMAEAEEWITDALDELGVDSDAVARSLRPHADADDDPLCAYLQQQLDPQQKYLQILHCDVMTLDFAVLGPDGCTWSHASIPLPAAVWVFCCRADAGEFGQPVVPR